MGVRKEVAAANALRAQGIMTAEDMRPASVIAKVYGISTGPNLAKDPAMASQVSEIIICAAGSCARTIVRYLWRRTGNAPHERLARSQHACLG